MTIRLPAVLLGLVLLAAPASAQQPDDLTRVLDTLLAHWQAGNAGGVVELGAGRGVELEVQGQTVGQISGRRAVAAFRHIFSAQKTVDVRSDTPSRVAGTTNLAFVELTWVIRPDGAPVSEHATVFIGFVREGPNWKVSQIRILP